MSADIRVTAEDLGTGEDGVVVLKAGQRGQYVVICAEPMYVAHEQHYANGTVLLTLKHRDDQVGEAKS